MIDPIIDAATHDPLPTWREVFRALWRRIKG